MSTSFDGDFTVTVASLLRRSSRFFLRSSWMVANFASQAIPSGKIIVQCFKLFASCLSDANSIILEGTSFLFQNYSSYTLFKEEKINSNRLEISN